MIGLNKFVFEAVVVSFVIMFSLYSTFYSWIKPWFPPPPPLEKILYETLNFFFIFFQYSQTLSAVGLALWNLLGKLLDLGCYVGGKTKVCVHLMDCMQLKY